MQRTLRISLLVLALVAARLPLLSSSSAADFSAIWDSHSGNWDDPLHWSTNPNYPNNASGVTYDAIIDIGHVTLNRDITIQRLYLSFGLFPPLLDGGGTLTLNEGLTWTGGYLQFITGGVINLAPGSTSTIADSGISTFNWGTMNNAGTVTQSSDLTGIYGEHATINNLAVGTWILKFGALVGNGVFNNAGTVMVVDPNAFFSSVFNNTGTVLTAPFTGLYLFSLGINNGGSSSGTFVVPSGAILQIWAINGAATYTFTSGAAIIGEGATFIHYPVRVDIVGNSTINTSLTTDSLLTVASGATLSLTGAFTQTTPFAITPTIRLEGGTISSTQPLNLQSGYLTGSGTINGDINSNATISPGASAGTLTVNGNVSLLSSSKSVMEIGGVTQGKQYDYIAIAGALTVGGTLELRMLNGFESKLNPSQRFILVTSKSLLGGVFANVANGARLTTADGLASFKVNYGDGSPYGPDNIVLSDPLVVPEPATLVLFAGGALALALRQVRRR
jgi:hypothetical protein